MANIHAINAQGTEYGLEATNGISQAQAAAVATIGDVADLTTTAKATLVASINEVNAKLTAEKVLFENSNPENDQTTQTIAVSEIETAKALKIVFGTVTSYLSFLEEKTFPLIAGKVTDIYLAQVQFNANDSEQQIRAREISMNANRSSISISNGTAYIRNTDEGTERIISSASSAKVIKIIALF